MKKICAVIVTYNRLDFLKEALNSIKNQSLIVDIIVVNNGSTDGTKEFLEAEKDIQVINQTNVGGAGGFFTGIKWAAENKYDLVWIMDDDVIPDKNCIKELYENYVWLAEIKKEKVGFLCSKVINTEGESVNVPQIDSRPNKTGYPDWNKYLQDGIVKVTWATFVSVLIPTSVIYEVGLPLKELFIWGDDVEYTKRISQNYLGFQIGKSIIKHLRYGGILSIFKVSDSKRIKMYFYKYRNNFWFAMKGYKGKRGLFHEIKNNLIEIIKLLCKGEFKKVAIINKGIMGALRFKASIQFPQDTK